MAKPGRKRRNVEREPNGRAMRSGQRDETMATVLAYRRKSGVPEAELRAHCRAQLARLFGPQALTPRAELFKDWAIDPYTATAADIDSLGQHPEAPASGASSGPWAGRLTGIGSEWSRQFPGYVAGAIDAASIGVRSLAALSRS